jgi:MFS family permease
MGASDKSSDAQAVPTAVRWHILAILLAYSFMSWFNRASMAAAGDERIMPQYGITPEVMGRIYSAFLLAYALFMTPGGWFIDRFGPWRALVLMGFGSALFGTLTGAVGLLGASLLVPALLVIRALMGVCSAPIYPASSRIVSHWIPYPQRSFANGMVNCAAPVGIACTFVGFGALIDLVNWPMAFVITGGITALLALLWWLYATDRPEQHPSVNDSERRVIEQDEPAWNRHDEARANLLPREDSEVLSRFEESRSDARQPESVAFSSEKLSPQTESVPEPSAPSRPGPTGDAWHLLLRNRSLIFLTISYGAVGYFEYLFTFWMHFYFDDVLRMGKVESRYYAGITYLAEAVGMFVGGWLADRCLRRYGCRRGRAIVPVGGMLGSALFLGIGLTASEPGWIVAWFALAVGAVGMCEGPFWATAIELGGRRAGTSAGICNTGGNAGGLIAPVITPWVSAHLGWPFGIGLGSLVCLCGAILWWWIDPAERCEG